MTNERTSSAASAGTNTRAPGKGRSCRRARRPDARRTCRGRRRHGAPGILFAATAAPTPLPQTTTARSALAGDDGIGRRPARSRGSRTGRRSRYRGSFDSVPRIRSTSTLRPSAGNPAWSVADGDVSQRQPSPARTTCSAVKPNSFRRLARGRGAEAVDADESPRSPTQRSQPKVAPASTETRAVTGARQDRLAVLRTCCAKISQHGIDTTRAAIPSPSQQLARLEGECTSEPVAIMMACGGAARASASTYAPRARPDAGASLSRSSTGSFWRVSTMATGPSRCVIAQRQASTVSLASAGRTTARFGMARSDIRCSTGWCVGPSSPRPRNRASTRRSPAAG